MFENASPEFIEYLTSASDVTKLDEVSKTSAIYILRMLNVYRIRGEVDEFIESGLGLSLAKIARDMPEVMTALGEAVKELRPEVYDEYKEALKELETTPVPTLADLGDIYTIFKYLRDYIFINYGFANYFYDEPELKIKGTVFETFPTEVNPENIKHMQDLTHKDAIRLLRVFSSFRRKDIVDKFLTDIGDFDSIYDMFSLFVDYLFHEYENANYFLNEPELDPKFKEWQTTMFGRPVRILE